MSKTTVQYKKGHRVGQLIMMKHKSLSQDIDVEDEQEHEGFGSTGF